VFAYIFNKICANFAQAGRMKVKYLEWYGNFAGVIGKTV
jgi:hypothetical protein